MAELKDRKQLQGLRNEGQTACCRSMKGDPSSSPQTGRCCMCSNCSIGGGDRWILDVVAANLATMAY